MLGCACVNVCVYICKFCVSLLVCICVCVRLHKEEKRGLKEAGVRRRREA